MLHLCQNPRYDNNNQKIHKVNIWTYDRRYLSSHANIWTNQMNNPKPRDLWFLLSLNSYMPLFTRQSDITMSEMKALTIIFPNRNNFPKRNRKNGVPDTQQQPKKYLFFCATLSSFCVVSCVCVLNHWISMKVSPSLDVVFYSSLVELPISYFRNIKERRKKATRNETFIYINYDMMYIFFLANNGNRKRNT